MKPQTRTRLVTLHRWTALALLPVYVVVLISGAVLAVRPILRGPSATRRGPIDVRQLGQLVRRLEQIESLDAISVADDARTVTTHTPSGTRVYDLQSGASSAPFATPAPDIFDIARQVHVRLWIGAGFLVTAATFGMLVLIAAWPILSRPRLRNTILGWHISSGWTLYPLLLFLPLTAALIVLPIGRGLHRSNEAAPLTISQALAIAAKDADLAAMRRMERMRIGSVFMAADGPFGESKYVIRPDGAERVGGPVVDAARMAHIGEWKGAVSGVLNLLGVLGLFGSLITGVVAWSRNTRRRAARHHAENDARIARQTAA